MMRAPKGTFDILPESVTPWRRVYEVTEEVLSRAGVQELSTPVFEHTEVFTKSAGESSDLVVQKEMYSFTDAAERSLTLRPEFTGGVMRAFIEHGMHTRPSPVKLWSKGAVFRAEIQPQRGRFRQFHQVNCELLGLETPLIDAEAIALLYNVLSTCGVQDMMVRLGSVGDPEDRVAYNAYLRETLEPRRSDLSETSQERLRLNPMRVLDSKDAGDKEIVKTLKRPLEFLNLDARAHFEGVQSFLREWGVPFEVDDSIVRGLDYYHRTAFEIHSTKIGAQSAICGGGRYDGLIASMGGQDTPGVGWAFGVERVIDAMKEDGVVFPEPERPLVYFVPMDSEAVAEVAREAQALRADYFVEYAYRDRKPGNGLKDAARSGARYAALRGSRERAGSYYQLKNLDTGEQFEVPQDGLRRFLEQTPPAVG